jgi:hypothetical protein
MSKNLEDEDNFNFEDDLGSFINSVMEKTETPRNVTTPMSNLQQVVSTPSSTPISSTIVSNSTNNVNTNNNNINNSIIGNTINIPEPQLQNVVSTVNLGTKLDLKIIALHARNAEYNPNRFAAVIMRIREPKTTALIFASGKK